MTLIIVEEDTGSCGRVVFECIGILNFALLAKTLSEDEYRRWVKKYHPMYFPSANIMKTLIEKEHDADYGFYAFCVPTEQMNKDWKPQGTKFGADTNYKTKRLPLITSSKQIQKWQTSVLNGVLTPDYFYEADTWDNLKTAVGNLYNG